MDILPVSRSLFIAGHKYLGQTMLTLTHRTIGGGLGKFHVQVYSNLFTEAGFSIRGNRVRHC